MKEEEIKYIELEIHSDKRGDLLSVEESTNGLPFSAQRSFYLYNVPENEKRANHAVDSELFILALTGTVMVTHVSNDNSENSYSLSNNNKGLYIPANKFINLHHFSSDALIAIYASKKYQDTIYLTLEELKSL